MACCECPDLKTFVLIFSQAGVGSRKWGGEIWYAGEKVTSSCAADLKGRIVVIDNVLDVSLMLARSKAVPKKHRVIRTEAFPFTLWSALYHLHGKSVLF